MTATVNKTSMKEVLELINIKKQELSKSPFYDFLLDTRVDARQRLAWAPCYAHLAMSFAELLRYEFRKEPTNDKVQQLLNDHTYEEYNHHLWFLEDMEKLGFNKVQSFTDTLKAIWNEDTIKTRQIHRKVSQMTYNADSVELMAMMEMIETATYIFFSSTKKVTDELKQRTKLEYRFFGDQHVNAEVAHTISKVNVQDFLENLEITEEQKNKSCEAVEQMCELIVEFLDGLLKYAQKYQVQADYATV